MTTTLITGGAGFIGSRLALHLVERGQTVLLLDNFDPYYNPELKRAHVAAVQAAAQQHNTSLTLIEGDVRDADLIRRLFPEYDVTRVAHLAAMANVRYSVDRGALYADVNVTGSVNLFDAAARHGVETFVFGSTSSIYGNSAQIPFVEDDHAMLPLAPYPASKRAAELFAHSYANLFGLNVTCLRFFNVYGPHGRVDMMPMRAIEAILNGEMIDLWGGGELKRDWTYIDDIVEGVAAALERPLGYQLINLGCGSPISLNEFIRIYEQLIGKQAVTQIKPAPPTEPLVTYCDNSKAQELLGFAPKIDVREGLARTWAWYKAQYKM